MDTEFFQGKDIGCKRHLAGREFMSLAVTAKKCDVPFAEPANQNSCAGLAEWRIDIMEFSINNTLSQRIAQARAAYYTN
jgi:hypothetical protein